MPRLAPRKHTRTPYLVGEIAANLQSETLRGETMGPKAHAPPLKKVPTLMGDNGAQPPSDVSVLQLSAPPPKQSPTLVGDIGMVTPSENLFGKAMAPGPHLPFPDQIKAVNGEIDADPVREPVFGSGLTNMSAALRILAEPSVPSSVSSVLRSGRLPSDLSDPSILRGISVRTVLSGFGSAFVTANGSINPRSTDYSSSFEVHKLDDFISHTWACGRWQKTAMLLFIYNGDAALGISLLASALLAFLQTDFVNVLPRAPSISITILGDEHEAQIGMWSTCLSPFVFLVVLLAWQRIRTVCVRSRVLFLDRFCVDQVDKMRKMQAIFGLAGFLKHSQRLVICWTPQYLTRLWTVYELVTWCHLKGSIDDVLFQPTSQAGSKFVGLFAGSAFLIIRTTLQVLHPDVADLTTLALACIWALVANAIHIRSIKDLGLLPEQFATFSFDNVNCFCCSNNHEDPMTGDAIQCDREFVYETLVGRSITKRCNNHFPDDNREPQRQVLNQFEQFVRTELACQILATAGAWELSYRHLIFMFSPIWWYMFDMIPAAWSIPLESFMSLQVFYASMALLVLPVWYGLLSKVLHILDASPRPGYVLKAFCRAIFPVPLIGVCLIMPVLLLRHSTSKLPYIFFLLCMVPLNVLLFKRRPVGA